MEESRNIKRSDIWNEIYKEVKELPIDAKGMDAPDAPSVTTSIEQIFLKLLSSIHDVNNSLDLEKMERKLDEVLDNETSESLKDWLHSKRL